MSDATVPFAAEKAGVEVSTPTKSPTTIGVNSDTERADKFLPIKNTSNVGKTDRDDDYET